MHEPTPTVYVVDDDADVCRALGRLLRSAGYAVQLFTSPSQFLSLHDPQIPACVLLDFGMPELNGLEVQAALAKSGCRRPIVFLSGNATITVSVDAMRSGAVTFLTKPVARRELLAAVEEALRKDAELRRESSLQDAVLGRLATLTAREREVLAGVVAGRLNKQIAAELGTVVKTIKVHRSRVMQKMGARSLAQLVRLAISVGITGDDRRRDVAAVPDAPHSSLPDSDPLEHENPTTLTHTPVASEHVHRT